MKNKTFLNIVYLANNYLSTRRPEKGTKHTYKDTTNINIQQGNIHTNNNKDTTKASFTSFWYLYPQLWTVFTPCFGASVHPADMQMLVRYYKL